MNLNQVTVPSTDLNQAIPFYESLGLTLIVKALPRYARFMCPDEGATFSLHQVAEMPVGERIVVYFECEDLDKRVTSLQNKDIVFDSLPEDTSWLWREAHLRDPDGNKLILYYAGENRLNPPWRI